MTSLQVYLISGCIGCDQAMATIERLNNCESEGVDIQVIDLTDGRHAIPDDMFAVPAWYIDGKLLQFGNPTIPQIMQRLRNVCSDPDNF